MKLDPRIKYRCSNIFPIQKILQDVGPDLSKKHCGLVLAMLVKLPDLMFIELSDQPKSKLENENGNWKP